MNVSEEWQAYFGPAAGRLGREAGLSVAEAERVLREGLPLQLAALREHARTPGGERQVAEAVQHLPRFASVEAALAGPDGASILRGAGQLLGPALLGPRMEAIARDVAGSSNPGGVRDLLQMTLPLALSFLGQHGFGDPGPRARGEEAAPGAPALTPGPSRVVVSAAPGFSPQELTSFLRAQLGGATAVRLGILAGFADASAARATQAALPVVLGAIARKGRSEGAAGVLLSRSSDFERLADAGGDLNPHLLDDPVRVAQVEGQGRGLLGTLFGTADGGKADVVRLRLGATLGAPGESAGRLLALLTPLVLGLLVRRARRDGLDAGRLSTLLAGVEPLLPGLLPADLPGLGPLVKGEVGGVSAPRPVAPPPPLQPARRRGVPGWSIPLLLLLLGGLYVLRSGPPPTSAGTTGAGVTLGSPAPGTTLPLADLTLRGTGRPGETLTIEDGGLEVASAQVGPDGRWQVTLSAPTLGEHAYAARGGDGATSAEVRVTITAEDLPEVAEAPAPDAGPTAPPRETFAITGPAPGAGLPAGSFTLRGTGPPGESLQVLEDGTSLGNVTVSPGGVWSLDVPSPSPGPHTYAVYAGDATELGRVDVTVGAFDTLAATGACDREYTLSLSDGQTVDQPFRFGGVGQGEGYRVTVRRDGRVVGTRELSLDPACGWSYQSRPGAGSVTYEVRPLGSPEGAPPLSVVSVTVRP